LAKTIISALIGMIPVNSVKCFLYRTVLGYSIGKNVKIGFSLINCDKASIGDNVRIGSFNNIRCRKFEAKDDVHLGNFIWATPGQELNLESIQEFSIGKGTWIYSNKYFDLSQRIEIGYGTHVGGVLSFFYTHGPKSNETQGSIGIGNLCFIGGNCVFVPNTKISDECFVGAGSVVTKRFEESRCLIAGNPAEIKRRDYEFPLWSKKVFGKEA
jgi:acetyltransferase-like isoleucine patch superfamily enzyme